MSSDKPPQSNENSLNQVFEQCHGVNVPLGDGLWDIIASQLTEDSALSNTPETAVDDIWLNAYFDGELSLDDPSVVHFESQLREHPAANDQLQQLQSLSDLLFNYHLSVEKYVDHHQLCPDHLADKVMDAYRVETRPSVVRVFTTRRWVPALASVAAAITLLVIGVQTNFFGLTQQPANLAVQPQQEEFLLASSVSNKPVPTADEYFINYCNTVDPVEQDSMTLLYSCVSDTH